MPLPKKSEPETPKRRWKRWLLLLLLLLPYGGYRLLRPDPHLTRVKQIQAQLDSDPNRTMPADQRQKLFEEMRREMGQLSSASRQQLFAEGQRRQEQEMDRYLAMSRADQRRYLDERINRMVQGQNARPGGGPPGAGARPTGGMPVGFAGPRPPGGTGSGKLRSPDEIEAAKKKILDRTSTDLRAKMDRFRRDLEQRAKERGIALPTGRR